MPIDVFNDHPLVHGLTDEERARVAGALERVEHMGGEHLCMQGTPAPGLLLVSAGTLVVTQKGHAGGEDLTICELEAPTVVGEMELLTGRASVCSVVARQAAVGFLLPPQAFRLMMQQGDEAAAKLIRNIAQVLVTRLIESNRRYLAEVDPHVHESIGEALTGYWEHVGRE